MYEFVDYESRGYQHFVFHNGKDEHGALITDSHLIPLQAVADRMELLGLESIEQTLEYLGREHLDTAMSDGLHEPMQDAYRAVVQEEFKASQRSTQMLPRTMRQTAMNPLLITSDKREKLERVRTDVLAKLGMRSRIHSEPMVRVLDATRPVERTRPAAAEAMLASPECIREAVEKAQGVVEALYAWRVQTLASYVPAVQDMLLAQVPD